MNIIFRRYEGQWFFLLGGAPEISGTAPTAFEAETLAKRTHDDYIRANGLDWSKPNLHWPFGLLEVTGHSDNVICVYHPHSGTLNEVHVERWEEYYLQFVEDPRIVLNIRYTILGIWRIESVIEGEDDPIVEIYRLPKSGDPGDDKTEVAIVPLIGTSVYIWPEWPPTRDDILDAFEAKYDDVREKFTCDELVTLLKVLPT